MGAWFVGAKEAANVYQARQAMRKDPAECDDVGKDVWVAFLRSKGWLDETVCAAMPQDHIFFDGGGCVRQDEAKVSWEANGCRMKTYVRHLPFVLDTFRWLKASDPLIPGCAGFGGFCRAYIMSERTIRESVVVMERLLRGTESLRQELEMGMQGVMNRAGAVSLRKCGCMSGLMYAECCGKHIEGEEHKRLRESVAPVVE